VDQVRTPSGTISQPIENGRGWPFGSPAFDVSAFGYEMSEHTLEGVAQSYRPVEGSSIGLDGIWNTEPAERAPYRTRLYVVRPRDPALFNGVVLVNWQNVTAGVDLGAPTPRALELGYAWMGVTTQRVAIDGQKGIRGMLPTTAGLPDWDPVRYGSLDHPGDAFSYDIFSQAGRAVGRDRGTGPVDLLGGLQPRLVIGVGASQSSIRLGSYLNIAHRRDRVFDGYLLEVHWGMCPYPPDQPLQESFMPIGDGCFAGSARVCDDGDVPIMVISTESEFAHNLPVRQPDTDTFRHWEIAGAAHASPETTRDMEGVFDRDGVANILAGGDRNTVEWQYIVDAALRRLTEWIDTGTAPRSFPRIATDETGSGIARDADGNAVGGIRLPDLAAPTAVHLGANPGNPLAALTGQSTPFTREQVEARYHDSDDYIHQWDEAVTELAAAGAVLPDAVGRLRERGRHVAEKLFQS
jgi:hypothetical protein